MNTTGLKKKKTMTLGDEYLDFLQFCLPPVGGGTLSPFTQRYHVRTAAVRVWTSDSIQSTGDNITLLITSALTNCVTPQ